MRQYVHHLLPSASVPSVVHKIVITHRNGTTRTARTMRSSTTTKKFAIVAAATKRMGRAGVRVPPHRSVECGSGNFARITSVQPVRERSRQSHAIDASARWRERVLYWHWPSTARVAHDDARGDVAQQHDPAQARVPL